MEHNTINQLKEIMSNCGIIIWKKFPSAQTVIQKVMRKVILKATV